MKLQIIIAETKEQKKIADNIVNKNLKRGRKSIF